MIFSTDSFVRGGARVSRLLCYLCLLVVITATGCDNTSRRVPGRAAIASADPLATAAGMEIIAAGGNAFDAAVAVAATLGVVEPASSGFGGGGFFLLYVAGDDEYRFIDAREAAPQAASRDMYLDLNGKPVPGASMEGGLAAGIPGQPAGLVYLTENFGRLPLAESLQPAIRNAKAGFAITPRALLGLKFRNKTLQQSAPFSAVFYPGGNQPQPGDLIVQEDLARTIERFAAGGKDGFYGGETARLLVDAVSAANGLWTMEDLADYKIIEREPIYFDYNGMHVVSAPPPSSGGVVLAQMMNFLSTYDLESVSTAQQTHYMIEAMKLAYRDRAVYLGDPDFTAMPLDVLLTQRYMEVQRGLIKDDEATPSSALPGIEPDGSEGTQTTHFSIIDKDGNRVAATVTINTWYGAGFMAAGTGVILNNEMDDFSIKRGVPNEFGLIGDEANSVAANKRPLSSMSPSFLESDRGIAVVGTPGGSRIITMVLQAALAWHEGASAEEMVSAKRFHHQYWPDVVNYEPGAINESDLEALAAMGHMLSPSKRPYGNMNVVTWDYATDEINSATDPRGEGEGRVY
jgi:gamma-glutamyltranspeptidase/glutathione hydrolase